MYICERQIMMRVKRNIDLILLLPHILAAHCWHKERKLMQTSLMLYLRTSFMYNGSVILVNRNHVLHVWATSIAHTAGLVIILSQGTGGRYKHRYTSHLCLIIYTQWQCTHQTIIKSISKQPTNYLRHFDLLHT